VKTTNAGKQAESHVKKDTIRLNDPRMSADEIHKGKTLASYIALQQNGGVLKGTPS
jgi:hypothetical protein